MKSTDVRSREQFYQSSRYSRPSRRCSTFMPWKWMQSREIGCRLKFGETSNLNKSFYSSFRSVNYWEPQKTVGHGHHGGIFNFDFASDGSLLVAACERHSILMFDPFNGKLVNHKNNAHQDCVNCVRFLDTRIFATCSDDATVALWDARNLKQRIRTLEGHSNWVKNIEYANNLGLLVTSGFDGSIYTWDINHYSTEETSCKKVFYSNSLMRSKLTQDNSKLIITTAGGFMVIIHDLDLLTLADDLGGFEPNIYRMLQVNSSGSPLALMYNRAFERKRNRVELISDFPAEDQAEVIASLQWTCVHNIQELTPEEIAAYESRQGVSADANNGTNDDNPEETEAGTSAADPQNQYLSNLNILSRNLLTSGIRRFGQVLQEDTAFDSDTFPSLAFPAEDRFAMPLGRGENSSSNTHSDSESSDGNEPYLNREVNSVDQMFLADEEYANYELRSDGPIPQVRIIPGFRPLRVARRHINTSSNSITTKIHQNKPRLLHFIEEPNVGKGFIKELCFSTDGRIVCSPFGNGVRLLAFDTHCQELCDCVPTSPVKLHEVGTQISHGNVVVTTKFSPVHFMFVSGCLGGKVVFHQPVL